MEKEFRTITYGAKFGDGAMRLKLNTDNSLLQQHNIEVKAKVNLDNGQVTFFIEEEDLKTLQEDNKEK